MCHFTHTQHPLCRSVACYFFRNEIQSVQRFVTIARDSIFASFYWHANGVEELVFSIRRHCHSVVCFHVVFAPQTIAKMPILCKCSRREANFVQLRREFLYACLIRNMSLSIRIARILADAIMCFRNSESSHVSEKPVLVSTDLIK